MVLLSTLCFKSSILNAFRKQNIDTRNIRNNVIKHCIITAITGGTLKTFRNYSKAENRWNFLSSSNSIFLLFKTEKRSFRIFLRRGKPACSERCFIDFLCAFRESCKKPRVLLCTLLRLPAGCFNI